MNKKARKIPIKFRGKDIETGDYRYGYLVVHEGGKYEYWIYGGEFNYPVEPDSVRQLADYDVDGREVYEGDELYLDYPEDDFHKEYKASVMALALSADGCYHAIGKVKLKGAD